jgi:hypothetical protein
VGYDIAGTTPSYQDFHGQGGGARGSATVPAGRWLATPHITFWQRRGPRLTPTYGNEAVLSAGDVFHWHRAASYELTRFTGPHTSQSRAFGRAPPVILGRTPFFSQRPQPLRPWPKPQLGVLRAGKAVGRNLSVAHKLSARDRVSASCYRGFHYSATTTPAAPPIPSW